MLCLLLPLGLLLQSLFFLKLLHFLSLGFQKFLFRPCGLQFQLLLDLKLGLGHVWRWVHYQHIVLHEEQRHRTHLITEVVAELFVVRCNKNLVLVPIADIVLDAFVGAEYAAWMFAGQFHDFLTRLKCLLDPWHSIFLQIFKLSQDALGHEHERLVLENLLEVWFEIHWVLGALEDKVGVKEYFKRRHKFVYHTVEIDKFVVFLSSLYSHFFKN